MWSCSGVLKIGVQRAGRDMGISDCDTELVLGPSVTQADEFDAAAAGALKRGAQRRCSINERIKVPGNMKMDGNYYTGQISKRNDN